MSELNPQCSSVTHPGRASRWAGEDQAQPVCHHAPPPAPPIGNIAIAWRRWSRALRVSALGVECVADRRKRINMKAENGIRRPQDNVPTRPPSMTTASCFHSLASGAQSM
ncbi:hypothetical protein VULLAG_LOCUS6390 [Vulpes lagopus]